MTARYIVLKRALPTCNSNRDNGEMFDNFFVKELIFQNFGCKKPVCIPHQKLSQGQPLGGSCVYSGDQED